MAAQKKAFSKTFLGEMKTTLEAEMEKLEKELGKFTTKNEHVEGDYDASFPEYGDKSDDNAHEVEQYTVNKPLEITLEKALRDIKKALTRMEEGSYGVCKYCDLPIEEKRLQARPTSSSCVSCKKTLTNEA